MDVNEYDERGRTPLMNAAIAGDLQEVRRLLELGADPKIKDKSFVTTKAANFAGRLARKSEIHRQIYELLISVDSTTSTESNVEKKLAVLPKPVCTNSKEESEWPYETFRAISGRQITRVRSSVFYLGGIGSLLIGIGLLANGQLGGGLNEIPEQSAE